MARTENKTNNDTLRKNTVVIIPCFNAGDRLKGAVENALAQVDQVIVINDGCTDGCTDVLDNLPVQVITFSNNCGKGHAIIAGIRMALKAEGTEVIALMDADGQHDASELPGLYQSFQTENADLVIGARTFDREQVPWRSRFGNKVTVWVMGVLCGRHLPDTQCGYRLLSPKFAQRFLDTIPGGRYETEMRMLLLAIREGFHIVSTPIATLYEPGNISSHFRKVRDSFRIYWALLQNVLFG